MNKFLILSITENSRFIEVLSIDVIYNKEYDGLYFHWITDYTKNKYICRLQDLVTNIEFINGWEENK